MFRPVAVGPHKKRIVILGGGSGGVCAAIHLEKLLAGFDGVEVCLVSRDNFFLFTPMLHEVAASDLEITNIINPLRKLLRRVDVIVGAAEEIDLPNKQVSISQGYRKRRVQLEYDHLVLALGSVTNFYDIPGLADLAVPMKSLRDAIRLRTGIIRHLEEAHSECNYTDRQSLLTFIVAGGGFAGVETVAALNDFVREALPFYPNLCEGMLRVMLVHSGAVILPELGESLGRYAREVLDERGVEILLNTRVKGVTEETVSLAHHDPVPCRTLVWTAGTVPSPIVSSIPCAKEHGRISVNCFLQVKLARILEIIFGFNFSGFFAWWMWRTVYLSKLPGLDKKVRVAFDWTLDLLFPKDVCAVQDLEPRNYSPETKYPVSMSRNVPPRDSTGRELEVSVHQPGPTELFLRDGLKA